VESLRKESVLVLARSVRGRLPLAELLNGLSAANRQLRVPMFQRRYCWGPPQWQGLWRDLHCLTSGLHHLGRLTVYIPDTPARSNDAHTAATPPPQVRPRVGTCGTRPSCCCHTSLRCAHQQRCTFLRYVKSRGPGPGCTRTPPPRRSVVTVWQERSSF
jgi:hypothetical protein